MKASTKVLLGIGGVALLASSVAVFARRGRLGSYEPGRMPLPPMVRETRAGGMITRHYRSPGLGIRERIGLIQKQIFESIHDPKMRQIAAEVVRHCPERDDLCETRAIYDAVRNRVRYTGDIAPIRHGPHGPKEGIDYYQSAYRTWTIGAGDCDDQTILVSTLLALNGIEPRLRTTAASFYDDESHIYGLAGLPKLSPSKWVAVDTTLPGRRFGYEAPYGRRRDYDA